MTAAPPSMRVDTALAFLPAGGVMTQKQAAQAGPGNTVAVDSTLAVRNRAVLAFMFAKGA